MRVRIEESWRRRLQPEFDKPYFARLAEFVREEYRTQRVCPVNRDCSASSTSARSTACGW